MRTPTNLAPCVLESTSGFLGRTSFSGSTKELPGALTVGFQPNAPGQTIDSREHKNDWEQLGNRIFLTRMSNVYTTKADMTGQPKPQHLRRSKLFPIRLTPGEMAALEAASRQLNESVASILRKGATLYIQLRGRGGSRPKGGTK